MKVMIKTELERAFKSWSLWLALIIGMGLSIAQIITRIIPAAMNPLMGYMPDNATLMPISAFQVWIGNGVSFEYSLFIRLIPILAAMPYAVTYLSDIKSGIIKNYVTRTAKFNYLAAKYIAVFVTGGVVVVMPLLINYLTAITILPSLVWPVGVFANSVIIYGASIATNLLLTILDTISAIVAIRPPHTKSRIIYIFI